MRSDHSSENPTMCCCSPRLIVASLLLVAATASAADTYPVNIHRSMKKGDAVQVRVRTELSQKNTTTPNGGGAPALAQRSIKADITGRLDVVETDAKGEATRLTLTIASFTDADKNPLVQPGVVVTIDRTVSSVTLSNTGPELSADAIRILKSIYPPTRPADAGKGNDAFDSKEPRSVGEVWPVNTDAAAAQLRRSGYGVNPADISGEVKLVAVEKMPTDEMLHITASLHAENLQPPHNADTTVRDAAYVGSFEGHLPADPASLALTSSQTYDARATLSNDAAVTTVEAYGSKTETWTPIAK
jgi:hypothetical protein